MGLGKDDRSLCLSRHGIPFGKEEEKAGGRRLDLPLTGNSIWFCLDMKSCLETKKRTKQKKKDRQNIFFW